MALDTNIALANVVLDSIGVIFPAGSFFEIRTGASPGAEASAGGTLLVSITLPSSPWAVAAAAFMSRQNTWQDVGVGAGTAGHYRLKNAADTRRIDGSVGALASGADLELDNLVIAVSQVVSIGAWGLALA